MIEWRINGAEDGAAGTFLANHYSTLGPYFGNLDGHDWPHSPLANEPKKLELGFNQKMVEMTEIISNGTLKNVSLLDLPSFGSSIAWLHRHHRRESNWQTEINFETLQATDESFYNVFAEYKNLLESWENYLVKIYHNYPDASFTTSMESNKFFNFTKHIRTDFKTFLIAIHGSHLSPAKNTTPVWRDTAQKVFQSMENKDHVLKNGLYDKLIMRCTLRKDLLKRNYFYEGDGGGGCDLFLPTLTSKGFCYSFNGQTAIDTWIPHEVVSEFQNLFPLHHSDEYFYGAGPTEGSNEYFLLFLYIISKIHLLGLEVEDLPTIKANEKDLNFKPGI